MSICENCNEKQGKIYRIHKRISSSFEGSNEVNTYTGSRTEVFLCNSCIRNTVGASIICNFLFSAAFVGIGFVLFRALKNSGGGHKFLYFLCALLFFVGLAYLLQNIWLVFSFIKPNDNIGDHVAGTIKSGKILISPIRKEYKTRKQFEGLDSKRKSSD